MRRRRRRKKSPKFANVVIAVCLVVSFEITQATLIIYWRLREAIPASVVTALLGLWGGELLIVALRQVLGADIKTQTPNTEDSI